MHEAKVSDGVAIAYDTFGEPGEPPVLLVIGFGAHMIAWHDDFRAMLARRGRYVIRYDNRDCGLSTRFDDRPVVTGAFIAAVTTTAPSTRPAERAPADAGFALLSAQYPYTRS